VIPVERFGTVDQALRAAGQLDVMILDAPPNSTAAGLRTHASRIYSCGSPGGHVNYEYR
jgi:hypothetical protein